MELKLSMFVLNELILPEENEQSVYNEMISERQCIAQKFLSKGMQINVELKRKQIVKYVKC